jgi:excisionase family DNA binding protein
VNSPAPQLEPLLTAQEVADFLKVSLSMVYQLRREGKLPGIQVGALWRFNPEIVRAVGRGEVVAVAPHAAVLPMGPRRRV